MYFILLDSSSVKKSSTDSSLFKPVTLGCYPVVLPFLACTLWQIEAYRKSTIRKKKGGGRIRMLSMALEHLVHGYSTQQSSVPKWDSLLSPARGCQVFLYISYTEKKENSVLKQQQWKHFPAMWEILFQSNLPDWCIASCDIPKECFVVQWLS